MFEMQNGSEILNRIETGRTASLPVEKKYFMGSGKHITPTDGQPFY